MTLARRSFLQAGLGLGVAGAALSIAPLAWADADVIGDILARTSPPAGAYLPESLAGASARRLAFDNLHTGEKLDVAYWENGAYVPSALAAVNYVLRDHRSNEVHYIEPRLLDLLTALSHQLEAGPNYEVISGYRSPQTNAMLHAQSSEVAVGSLHQYGMAIDIRMAGLDIWRLRDAALSLDRGGVGYYPESEFVHVDVGRVRHWGGT
ncbi:MAG TPA: DUF882 domain-containing protein [Caulobacteraceae bacterium]|jgi:uncharacterized protein YcbK (DUF882 family)|nr:DUF882 domain-containing protein [Caulobacteraceae bacterium]